MLPARMPSGDFRLAITLPAGQHHAMANADPLEPATNDHESAR